MSEELRIRYPRRVLLRNALKFAGRTLGAVLARPKITGHEHLPKSGPLIMVGNHVGVVEVAMMASYVPWTIEVMGAGDIPLDPRYGWLAKLYSILPIKRGSMDRDGLNLALDVLKQGGIVGLFPEGGIWEASLRQARNGVAWLSNKANAPVLPIGFGGIDGAVSSILRMRRPRLVMNVGRVIPPVNVEIPGKSRKEALTDGANYIMDRIAELIPEEERRLKQQNYLSENFDFKLIIKTAGGLEVPLPEAAEIVDKKGLSKFFFRPVMLDVFKRNLRLPVHALGQFRRAHAPEAIASAADVILQYLQTNPYFFVYRFGPDEGEAMGNGLRQLRDAALWLSSNMPGCTIQLKPIRRYVLEVEEDEPAPVPEI